MIHPRTSENQRASSSRSLSPLQLTPQECPRPEAVVSAAWDSDDRVRNNALRVLALKLAKVPPTAHEVLLKALQSSNYQTAGYEAAGLVSIEVTDTNQETVAKALNASRDVKYRIGLLDAIRSGAQPSEALFAFLANT